MLIVLRPQRGYFKLSPEHGWKAESDHPKNPRSSINGSPPLTAKEMGKVIHALVYYVKRYGGEDYEYVDLSK